MEQHIRGSALIRCCQPGCRCRDEWGQQKANLNAPQVDGTTAMHWAVQSDDLETADLLMHAGANVSAANHAGATPLLRATINGNAAPIQTLR